MKRFAPLFFLLCSIALGQGSTGTAATKGVCSPANTGNNNTFNITCQGVSDKLGARLIDLLNRFAKNQTDTAAMMAKLDACIATVAPRRIPPQDKAAIIAFLREKPEKISVSAVADDPESFQFAQDWYDVLKAAGWEMQDMTVKVVMFFGKPLRGAVMRIHGEPIQPGATVQIPNTYPAAHLAKCFQKLNVAGFSAQLDPKTAEGTIYLQIGIHP